MLSWVSSAFGGSYLAVGWEQRGADGHEDWVELTGDVALETADDFGLGSTLCGSALHVGARGWVPAHSAHSQQVQRPVALAVTAAVKAIAGDLAGGGRDRRYANQVGECSLAHQAFGIVTDDGQQGRCYVGANAFDRHQSRGNRRHQLLQVPIERIDLRTEVLI